jgi:hypothetical protein
MSMNLVSRLNPITKQWDYVISQFERAVKAQKAFERQILDQGGEPSAYDVGWLYVLEVGLAGAVERRKVGRFDFWKTATHNEHRFLLEYLHELHQWAVEVKSSHKPFHDGMIEAMDDWRDAVLMTVLPIGK